ncbi:Uncharacterised protein [Segatella copri]|nr:Uncharacterised protein [Segatella copri]
MHLLHGNNPAINQVAQPHGEWRAATAGIKLLAIDGPTGIMSRHDAASARLCSLRVSLLQHLIIYTTRQRHNALLLCLFLQPTLVGLNIFSFCHKSI